jgi:oligosaccharyltransferase complex subunit alpha (ribophorin I)
MKPSALATAAFGLLWQSFVAAAGAAGGGGGGSAAPASSPPGGDVVIAPATAPLVVEPAGFAPPQVFANENLVQAINLERNYAKESVNVVVENVSEEPQAAYYVPFAADKIARVGAFEARDRKNPDAGVFDAAVVEFDDQSPTQYYRVALPSPLAPGAKQTLSISYFVLKAYTPLPAAIDQDDTQFLQYEFSATWLSAYPTRKQKTEVKAGSTNVPDYTRVAADGGAAPAEGPVVQGSKLTYGPFSARPTGATTPAAVRFEFTKPVTHVARLDRDVEVSHWGGNVAFEERYDLHNRGANLSVLFDRARWARGQYLKPTTHALKEMRFPLRPGSADLYYTDVIGNVTTSRFNPGPRSGAGIALLEARPRYPVFGGWRYPFTIGWNSDAKNWVRNAPGAAGHVLAVPFLEGLHSAEGAEYADVQLRIILPEGAENIRLHTTLPATTITSIAIETHRTFLDTLGRPAIVVRAHNLVDELRDRDVVVAYEVPLAAQLRKPVVVFASAMVVFAAWAVVGRMEVRFS